MSSTTCQMLSGHWRQYRPSRFAHVVVCESHRSCVIQRQACKGPCAVIVGKKHQPTASEFKLGAEGLVSHGCVSCRIRTFGAPRHADSMRRGTCPVGEVSVPLFSIGTCGSSGCRQTLRWTPDERRWEWREGLMQCKGRLSNGTHQQRAQLHAIRSPALSL